MHTQSKNKKYNRSIYEFCWNFQVWVRLSKDQLGLHVNFWATQTNRSMHPIRGALFTWSRGTRRFFVHMPLVNALTLSRLHSSCRLCFLRECLSDIRGDGITGYNFERSIRNTKLVACPSFLSPTRSCPSWSSRMLRRTWRLTQLLPRHLIIIFIYPI